MSEKVHELPVVPEVAFATPRRIRRPCDYGLWLAVKDLETQLGSIEAFNRVAEIAQQLKAQIDAGEIKVQNPCYAKNITGGTAK